MLIYCDTSAIIPLIIAESGTERCRKIWKQADAILVTRLVHVEVCAALERARRMHRITEVQLGKARDTFAFLWARCAVRELDETLMRQAGSLAHRFGLRGYDAVRCAAAAEHVGSQIAAATGDRQLLNVWEALGVPTIDAVGLI